MWWHTVTHERGSEGETGEWSGKPVPFTLPRNMVYPLPPLMRTPRLPVFDWTDVPRRFKWTRPFRRKTKSGFCACAITFQQGSTGCGITNILNHLCSQDKRRWWSYGDPRRCCLCGVWLQIYPQFFFFLKRLIYCSEMYKCLHEFPLKLFQIPVYMRLLT